MTTDQSGDAVITSNGVGYCFGSGEDGEMTLTEIEQAARDYVKDCAPEGILLNQYALVEFTFAQVQRAFEKCAKIVDETESESFQRLCPKCKLLAGEHLRAVLNKIRAASPKKPK